MTDNREKLYAKIKALLAKTEANGCTEDEALSALSKAKDLMDSYEVTLEDLQATEKEEAILQRHATRDTHGARVFLAQAISRFTGTRVLQNGKRKRYQVDVVFIGLRADVDLATWMLENLGNFVSAELLRYLARTPMRDANHRHHSVNGFVMGACGRIRERLDALRPTEEPKQSNSTALVVIKNQLIKKACEKLSIGKVRPTSRLVNRDAKEAGRAAGDRASIGRPTSGPGSVRLIGSS